ncbi:MULTISPECIES: oxygen-independent coproporphyrinogen III oxidase [unclassified Sinorhizobium]|uniref:oxygen-independent coproporphyrinogen III oxidase n=1 Tax=unclassified Sinorhizobium TaxID=2613772 RepID=UPI0024C229DA|nr:MULTISPECIES: oxygen-independent coproporphyrinogen III oxidase [unclassified Sinorhizobium]MDK1373223.1 oxygen-independent coproporphyrinogen III oxidase [Sinorhizobium sp. 6-70]MDK1480819.1 oxygen-independent coproporphyrinogen III oxidase [Sinorhizobium sp. 6-117]
MEDALVLKYAAPVPRYTSYPTAPHFSEAIGNAEYERWLGAIGEGESLSLYAHIPYCDRLCWFCACHTKQTLRYDPVADYLTGLHREIEAIGKQVTGGARVTALHLGGGSPTLVRPDDLITLKSQFSRHFTFAGDCEISVEMDPNDLDEARHDALAAIGMTRASFGIQDFDPVVQKAINRIQTYEQTRDAIEASRARGVHSVNCDVLYGLPHQTMATLERTIEAVLSLGPDRVALFGYAHVPWMKKHQQMIPEESLPGVVARYAQMARAGEMLVAAGYEAIGIDHFARPSDTLAAASREGRLRRNFQGYTDDTAETLIGIGASAIGQFREGYVQNMPATGEYLRRAEQGGLAAVRGYALTPEDRLRARVISLVMCEFGFSFERIEAEFPVLAASVIEEARLFRARDADGFSTIEAGVFKLTARGRPFARSVAAAFDAHLSNGRGRHSVAV